MLLGMKAIPDLLLPYIVNSTKGLTVDETTTNLCAQALLTRDVELLKKTFNVAVEAYAWPIVESLLNQVENEKLISKDTLAAIADDRPEILKNRFNLLPYFTSIRISAIGSTPEICEYILNTSKNIKFPISIFIALRNQSESISYRLPLMLHREDIRLFSDQDIIEALDAYVNTPPDKRIAVPPAWAANLLKKVRPPKAKWEPYMLAMKLGPISYDTWKEDLTLAYSELACFVLSEEAFKQVSTTKKIVELMDVTCVSNLAPLIIAPLSKEQLCTLVTTQSISSMFAQVLTVVDLEKHSTRVLKLIKSSNVELKVNTIFDNNNEAVIKFFLQESIETVDEVLPTLKEIMPNWTETEFTTYYPYLKYLELSNKECLELLTPLACLPYHFTVTQTIPTLANFKETIRTHHLKGLEYLLQTYPPQEQELQILAEECLGQRFFRGLPLIVKQLPQATQDLTNNLGRYLLTEHALTVK